MTIRHLSEVRPPDPPHRSGEPWTDEDYESLAHLCREGLDLTTLSERLGRAPQSVRDRARRMLPLDQRGVPGDRALTQLRRNLLEDPDYDWGHHLAATPPPRPVVNHVLPAPRYAGLIGLKDAELLVTAEALAQQRQLSETGRLLRVVADEIQQRGLGDALRDAAAVHARQRVDDLLGQNTSRYYPHSWADPDLSAMTDARGWAQDERGWAQDEPPW